MSKPSIKSMRAKLADEWRTTKMTREEFSRRSAAIDTEEAARDTRPWCQAETEAQRSGSSWASTSWACSRRATTTRGGVPMCRQHAQLADRALMRTEQRAREEAGS